MLGQQQDPYKDKEKELRLYTNRCVRIRLGLEHQLGNVSVLDIIMLVSTYKEEALQEFKNYLGPVAEEMELSTYKCVMV